MMRTACVCGTFLALVSFAFAPLQEGDRKYDAAKPKRDEELRQELLRMVREDQDARKELIKAPSPDSPAARKVANIDRKNTARMKEIVSKHGWPGKSLVGEEGAHAAWLLTQHADLERDFQKKCLKLLGQAVEADQASATDHAYLTDRILVADKKRQVFGTQFRTVDGKMEPYPIEDEKNVDHRRKKVGLLSLAEYRKTLEKVYNPKAKKE